MDAPRILVVDDDRSTATAVARVLTGQGYAVDMASDGPSALALVKKNAYSMAIVDFQMPGMNGVEFFREARETSPDLMGVCLTAYANINTVFPAIEAGIERVLSKPLDARELLRLTRELTATENGPSAV